MAHNWYECRDGFIIPRWLDCARFPPYDEWDPTLPAWTDIINVQGYGRPPGWAWAAWFRARDTDRPLTMDRGLAEQLALRIYDSQRFVHIVPAWKRQLGEWLTEIDDIEDQVSTIAWLAETVLNKFIPIPRGVLSNVQRLRRTLDDAEQVLQLGLVSRRSKSEWSSKQRELRAAKRTARTSVAKFLVWARQNWGNLLEAAQASNTWFDVGIVLGPIVGFVEEGIWGFAQATHDNYIIAADALLPGFGEVYREHWTEYADAFDNRWAELYEGAVMFTTDTIEQLTSGEQGFGEIVGIEPSPF